MIEVPNNLCTFSKYLMIDYSMFINCCISYRDGSNEIPTPKTFWQTQPVQFFQEPGSVQ